MENRNNSRWSTGSRQPSKKHKNRSNIEWWNPDAIEATIQDCLRIVLPDCHEICPLPKSISETRSVFVKYDSKVLRYQVPMSMPLAKLYPFLIKSLSYYEVQQNGREAIRNISRILGFEAVQQNIAFDYQMSIGSGQLNKDVELRCFNYEDTDGLNRYRIVKCLAIGGFSKVYLVRSKNNGKYYAMKVMSKKFIFQNQKQNVVENQKNICSLIEHPFVVKLYHSFETKNFTFFVLMVDCPGGELFYLLKKVRRMSEEEARFYFIQILYGLQYLHEKGIVYRDLKPENLLIAADGHIKIVDFGLSKSGMSKQDMTYSYCGSAEYMPPEMILKTGHNFGVDYYTLGALLYELITGLPPFYSRNEEQTRQHILYNQLSFPKQLPLSEQIKSLLQGLLNKNWKLRLGSLKGIKEILFHPWLGKVDSKKILSRQTQPPYSPNLNEINFDENELGQDQAEFTQSIKREGRVRMFQKQLDFQNIAFEAQGEKLSEERLEFLKMPLLTKKTANNSRHKQNSAEKILRKSPYLQRLVHLKHSSSGFDRSNIKSSSPPRKNQSNSMSALRKVYGNMPISHENRQRTQQNRATPKLNKVLANINNTYSEIQKATSAHKGSYRALRVLQNNVI